MGSSHEEALIRAFVDPGESERLVEYLELEGAREMLWGELAQAEALDARFADEIPIERQSPDEIAALLRSRGAPDEVRIVSGDADLDGLELDLDDAIDWVFGLGEPVFLSCIPGKVAYYEDEDGRRFVLERFGE